MATIDVLRYGVNGFSAAYMFDPDTTHTGDADSYAITDDLGNRLVFTGHDLTYNGAGKLIGGQVTSAVFFDQSGVKVAALSDLHISGKALGGFADYFDFYDAMGDLTFNGGKGDDYEYGTLGNDTMIGGAGDDDLAGNNGDDAMYGGTGNDRLTPYYGTDIVSGSKGNDTIQLGAPDSSAGGYIYTLDLAVKETQTVRSDGSPYNLVVTLTSIENVYGSGQADHVLGTGGANSIYGAGGDDLLDGRGGADSLNGSDGADTADYSAYLTATVDLSKAGAQNTGKAGHDTLISIERLTGGEGKNVFSGNDEANTLVGAGGNDILAGGDGADQLAGGEGDDRLEGGLGQDLLAGGNGADTFVFRTAADASDLIVDFFNPGDRIDFSHIDADTTQGGNQAFHFTGNGGFHGQAGELVYYQPLGTGGVPLGMVYVYGDIDGDGGADFTLTLLNRFSPVSATDFTL